MMIARAYSLLNSDAYIKTGWGYAKHRYWESSVISDASGISYLAGLGYDFDGVSLSVSYSIGDLDQESEKH